MTPPKLTESAIQELIHIAVKARQIAYAPYSSYAVGAALLTVSGRVFTGVNVENAAYSVTMCAERVAVFKAVSEGERAFSAIAIVTDNGGASCGSCRQVMAEFGLSMWVFLADGKGNLVDDFSVADLLPRAFSPNDLAA